MPPFIHRLREVTCRAAPPSVPANEMPQRRRPTGAVVGVASAKRSGRLDRSCRDAPSTAQAKVMAQNRRRDRSGRAAPSTVPGKKMSQHRRGKRGEYRKRKRTGAVTNFTGDCTEALGTVEETVLQHRQRHANFSGACTRCLWDTFGKRWSATCCVIPQAEAIEELPPRRSWCESRPVELGGTWALGCRVCWLAARMVKHLPKSLAKNTCVHQVVPVRNPRQCISMQSQTTC